ncbi:MAG TPA: fructose-6-phosphate aldolase [Candidatus Merdenecus merdavium]|nr:fructose-6-phosphate aldolase [Candidatus Merdenecus merdavium]
MKIILDTAHLEDIRKYNRIYEIAGVTSNPTILSRECADFFPLLQNIRQEIGDKELHVQVTASSCTEMLLEAKSIVNILGKDTYIKVPTNEEGIKTIKQLKHLGYKVTATAIYTAQQAMLAASVGADYVAPYYNRMNNLNMDSRQTITEIATLFKLHHCETEILAASFKNTNQIMDALLCGAHAVTASPQLYTQMVESPVIDHAIKEFYKDWASVYQDKPIYELK